MKLVDGQLGSVVAMTKHLVEAVTEERWILAHGCREVTGHPGGKYTAAGRVAHSSQARKQRPQARTRGGNSSQGCLPVTSD